MNKPIHPHQNASKQTAMENRINRNLSPSFARIQALAAKVSPPSSTATTDESASMPRVSEPKLAAPRPAEVQQRPAEPTSSTSKGFQPPPPPATHHKSASASARITPWIIASITLTLALFSGNYAWHTQQQVEELNLRLDQLAAQTTTPPATSLQKSNDNFAKTEQELLTLKQSQGQLNATMSTLQNEFAADTEQTGSRLETLETDLEKLISQAQAADAAQAEARDDKKEKPLVTENISSTAAIETTNSASSHDSTPSAASTTSSAVENWFINIASFSDPSAASSTHKKVHHIADSAAIKPVSVNGKTLYRIRADGYHSRADAEHEAQTLQTQLGLSGLWVSRD